MKIEEIHQCEASEGKIVCIEISNVGITRCAYCHKVVPYFRYFDKIRALKSEQLKFAGKELIDDDYYSKPSLAELRGL